MKGFKLLMYFLNKNMEKRFSEKQLDHLVGLLIRYL